MSAVQKVLQICAHLQSGSVGSRGHIFKLATCHHAQHVRYSNITQPRTSTTASTKRICTFSFPLGESNFEVNYTCHCDAYTYLDKMTTTEFPGHGGFTTIPFAYTPRRDSSVSEKDKRTLFDKVEASLCGTFLSIGYNADNNALESQLDLPGSMPEIWFTKRNLEMSNTGLQGLDFLPGSGSISSTPNSDATSPSSSITTLNYYHQPPQTENAIPTFNPNENSPPLVESEPTLNCIKCEGPSCNSSAIRTPDLDFGIHQLGSNMNGYTFILEFIAWFLCIAILWSLLSFPWQCCDATRNERLKTSEIYMYPFNQVLSTEEKYGQHKSCSST